MISVGVIGVGVMGAYHAQQLNETIAGAALAGTFDIVAARAAEMAAQAPGARAFANPPELITADEVDAVLIASLDPTHEEFVLACLEAGKPVLCEKPLSPTVEGCQRIVDAEAALGCQLVNVGFMRRHDPATWPSRRPWRPDTSADRSSCTTCTAIPSTSLAFRARC
jgi:myo-inositol 2-dehydrogenase/D-chiro-inositol 1-dehydrogenase